MRRAESSWTVRRSRTACASLEASGRFVVGLVLVERAALESKVCECSFVCWCVGNGTGWLSPSSLPFFIVLFE